MLCATAVSDAGACVAATALCPWTKCCTAGRLARTLRRHSSVSVLLIFLIRTKCTIRLGLCECGDICRIWTHQKVLKSPHHQCHSAVRPSRSSHRIAMADATALRESTYIHCAQFGITLSQCHMLLQWRRNVLIIAGNGSYFLDATDQFAAQACCN